MCKGTSKSSIHQEKMLFSLPEMVSGKKIRVDFDSPDISSNGGLVLIGNMQNSLAWQIGQLIPDSRIWPGKSGNSFPIPAKRNSSITLTWRW